MELLREFSYMGIVFLDHGNGSTHERSKDCHGASFEKEVRCELVAVHVGTDFTEVRFSLF